MSGCGGIGSASSTPGTPDRYDRPVGNGPSGTRDAARLPPTPMPAGLVFWLMADPAVLSLFNAISPIIGYGVIAMLGVRQVNLILNRLKGDIAPAAAS